MSYGIQIINQQNLIQIDENYSNYQLYSSGIRTTSDVYPYTFLQAPVNSLLLIRPITYESNIFWVCDRRKYSTKVEYMVSALGPTPFGSSGNYPYVKNYYYMLFVDSSLIADQTPQNFGFGLNVYKPNTKLAYSSNIATVPFIQNTYISSNTSQTISIAAPIGKTAYVEVSAIGRYGFADIFNGFNYDSMGCYNGIRFLNNTTAYYDPIYWFEGNDVYGGDVSDWFFPKHINFGAY